MQATSSAAVHTAVQADQRRKDEELMQETIR
jgi:hypothetical protein